MLENGYVRVPWFLLIPSLSLGVHFVLSIEGVTNLDYLTLFWVELESQLPFL